MKNFPNSWRSIKKCLNMLHVPVTFCPFLFKLFRLLTYRRIIILCAALKIGWIKTILIKNNFKFSFPKYVKFFFSASQKYNGRYSKQTTHFNFSLPTSGSSRIKISSHLQMKFELKTIKPLIFEMLFSTIWYFTYDMQFVEWRDICYMTRKKTCQKTASFMREWSS